MNCEEMNSCPFCARNKLNPTHYGGDGDRQPYMHVECEFCGIEFNFYAETFEQGIRTWNARPDIVPREWWDKLKEANRKVVKCYKIYPPETLAGCALLLAAEGFLIDMKKLEDGEL